MEYLIQELRKLVKDSYALLLKISEKDSEKPISEGKWSKKEIIGHLIDSTSNNHQRFVRAQLESKFAFPGYEQDKWIKLQLYQGEPWSELINLWMNYNLHLAHLVSAIPEDNLIRTCKVGDKEPLTLLLLFEDYINHLKHHLDQLLEK